MWGVMKLTQTEPEPANERATTPQEGFKEKNPRTGPEKLTCTTSKKPRAAKKKERRLSFGVFGPLPPKGVFTQPRTICWENIVLFWVYN